MNADQVEQATEKQIGLLNKIIQERQPEAFTAYYIQSTSTGRIGYETLNAITEKYNNENHTNIQVYMAEQAQQWMATGCPLPEVLSKKQASKLIDAILYRLKNIIEIWAALHLTDEHVNAANTFERQNAQLKIRRYGDSR